jgi:hypothetical protein
LNAVAILHVADMHAHPKLHRLVGGAVNIFGGDRLLYRDCALHGIDRAGEVGDDRCRRRC